MLTPCTIEAAEDRGTSERIGDERCHRSAERGGFQRTAGSATTSASFAVDAARFVPCLTSYTKLASSGDGRVRIEVYPSGRCEGDTVEAFVQPCKSRYPLTTPTGGTPQPIDHSYHPRCSHRTSAPIHPQALFPQSLSCVSQLDSGRVSVERAFHAANTRWCSPRMARKLSSAR